MRKNLISSIAVGTLFIFVVGARGEEGGQRPNVFGFASEQVKKARCEINQAMMPNNPGVKFPGDAGAPRWGMPDGQPAQQPLVRRSWTSLNEAEKQEFVDGVLKLKQTLAHTASIGASRADYVSYCFYKGEPYRRNLWDFYVELHTSAFVWMMQPESEGRFRMAHMGPQFLPWHRYILLRLEADLREVLGKPDFTFPYWDWEDCQKHPKGCPEIFDPRYLGSPGRCAGEDGSFADADVKGYLVGQGFHTQLTSGSANKLSEAFDASNIVCGPNPLQRTVGCDKEYPRPPTEADVLAIFEREIYDAPPYNNCATNQQVSFRQYIEGFNLEENRFSPICITAGCKMHGLGHLYIGGDMTSLGPPNDPVFFLHHANVDRLWAEWQDRNRRSSEAVGDYGNPGYPDAWRGPIFNFPEVRADELFDFRALGYRYDTNPEE